MKGMEHRPALTSPPSYTPPTSSESIDDRIEFWDIRLGFCKFRLTELPNEHQQGFLKEYTC